MVREMLQTDRRADYKIEPLILHRWSPRAMTGEEIGDEELMSLFEAARWAPSSMNNQLWRFVYAKRESEYWEEFLGFLTEGNRKWCVKAAVLMVVLSRKKAFYKDRRQRSHSFEAGTAYENLALEGVARGLAVHGMGGIHVDKIRDSLGLTEDWRVEMMAAVGKLGKREDLPDDLAGREEAKGRKPVSEIAFAGRLPKEEM